MGRLLVIFMMICNMTAMVLYMVDVQSGLMEECVGWEERITIQIDFALGIIFVLHSLLRSVVSCMSYFIVTVSRYLVAKKKTFEPLTNEK